MKYQNPDSYCFDAIFVTATLLDPKFALVLNKNQVNSAINYLETFSNDNNETEVIPQDTQEVSLKTAFSNIQNLIISQLSQEKKSDSKVCDEVKYYLEYLKTNFLKDFGLKIEFFGNNSNQFNEIFTSIKFWKSSSIINKFRIISRLALNILAIPATQAISERIFSISGDCLNDKRNSLNPVKLEREVMLIYNKTLLNLQI